jgi:hypothetical protein
MRRADILSFFLDREEELKEAGFLPSDFWEEAVDVLNLSSFISAGWAEATEAGQKAIDIVYDTMCSIREIGAETEFETINDFFLEQEVEEDDNI